LSREKIDMHNNDKYEQKGTPPIVAQTMKYTKHTVASLGQGDERSENGMFEEGTHEVIWATGDIGVLFGVLMENST
jgi:hypothetical protein